MIYVIEYNYPSKMLVEHINNYLEKKRVRNLPVKLVYNGNISYIDYDLKKHLLLLLSRKFWNQRLQRAGTHPKK